MYVHSKLRAARISDGRRGGLRPLHAELGIKARLARHCGGDLRSHIPQLCFYRYRRD